jgi:hypothetical protein
VLPVSFVKHTLSTNGPVLSRRAFRWENERRTNQTKNEYRSTYFHQRFLSGQTVGEMTMIWQLACHGAPNQKMATLGHQGMATLSEMRLKS